jgi:predicted HTH domain antitoxin
MTKVEFVVPIDTSMLIQQEAENKAKEAYIMTLLKYDQISSGRAAELLNISRLDVLDLMAKYDISPFEDSLTFAEFENEVEQAKLKLFKN